MCFQIINLEAVFQALFLSKMETISLRFNVIVIVVGIILLGGSQRRSEHTAMEGAPYVWNPLPK